MHLYEHIKSIIELHRVRRDLMIGSIKEYFLEDVKYTYPSGGLFTWIELREDLDSTIIM